MHARVILSWQFTLCLCHECRADRANLFAENIQVHPIQQEVHFKRCLTKPFWVTKRESFSIEMIVVKKSMVLHFNWGRYEKQLIDWACGWVGGWRGMKYVVGCCLSCQCIKNPIYVCTSTMKRHFIPHKKPLFPGVIFCSNSLHKWIYI